MVTPSNAKVSRAILPVLPTPCRPMTSGYLLSGSNRFGKSIWYVRLGWLGIWMYRNRSSAVSNVSTEPNLPSDGGIVELEVVELEVVVVVAVGLAMRAQTLFLDFLETNWQVTGTFTFLTWTVDFAPSFWQIWPIDTASANFAGTASPITSIATRRGYFLITWSSLRYFVLLRDFNHFA